MRLTKDVVIKYKVGEEERNTREEIGQRVKGGEGEH
jgi:hypothetical protein